MPLRLVLLILLLIPAVFGAGDADRYFKRPECPPIDTTVTEILNGKHDTKFVRTTGTITDVVHDEINPDFRFFILRSGNEFLYAPSQTIAEDDAVLEALIGAEVSVC